MANADIEQRITKEVVITVQTDETLAEPIDAKTVFRSSRLRWWPFCFGLYFAGFLYGLDATIAADVQVPIYEDFKSIEKLPWVGTGFPLGSIAVILLVGAVHARFDTKWLRVYFFTMFEVGSAICGAAPTIEALIAGRVLAGTGGAGLYIGGLTYLQAFTTPRERPLYNAATGIAWGTGAILGPLIGGALSVHASWRWAFYINLPVAGVLLPLYIFLFPHHLPQPHVSTTKKLATIDWLGAALNASTVVLLLVSTNLSGSTLRWSSATTITLWVLAGTSLLAFALQQTLTIGTSPEHRLFPAHLLRSRTMLALFAATASSAATLGVAIYYIPLLFEFTRGDSALGASVRLLPFIVPLVLTTMLHGALLPRLGRYAPFYLAGGSLVLVGSGLLHTVTPETRTAAIYGFEALAALGCGVSFQGAYSVAASTLGGADVPLGITLINVAQIGGLAVSLSVAGSVFQNVGFERLRAALQGERFPDEVLRAALAGLRSSVAGEFDTVERSMVVGAVVRTIGSVFVLETVAGATLVVAAVCMSWERLAMGPPRVGKVGGSGSVGSLSS